MKNKKEPFFGSFLFLPHFLFLWEEKWLKKEKLYAIIRLSHKLNKLDLEYFCLGDTIPFFGYTKLHELSKNASSSEFGMAEIFLSNSFV